MEIFPCVCVCVYVSVYVSACVSKEGEQWARRGKKLLNKWFLPFPSSSFSKWMMKMNGREREQDRQTGREGNWVNWCSNRLHVSYKIHTNFFFSFHRYQFEYRAQEWPLLLFFFFVLFLSKWLTSWDGQCLQGCQMLCFVIQQSGAHLRPGNFLLQFWTQWLQSWLALVELVYVVKCAIFQCTIYSQLANRFNQSSIRRRIANWEQFHGA